MATFIKLTRPGHAIRVNVEHIATYYPAHLGEQTTVQMAMPLGALDVNESAEQIDALIASATAPTFRCRSCGLTRTEATDGAGICADCYSRDL